LLSVCIARAALAPRRARRVLGAATIRAAAAALPLHGPSFPPLPLPLLLVVILLLLMKKARRELSSILFGSTASTAASRP
jgi:hypothetical protein